MPKHKNARSRPKTLYRVRNWFGYDQALVHRGSIKIWLAEDFGKNWHYAGEKQPGSQYEYRQLAITILLMIKNVFHLPNRATEGFVCSIFAMLGMRLPVPDHATLSRRGKALEIVLPKTASRRIVLSWIAPD